MKTKVLALTIALNVFAVAPLWAQEKSPDANLLAQLEKRLTQSESGIKETHWRTKGALAYEKGQDRENY